MTHEQTSQHLPPMGSDKHIPASLLTSVRNYLTAVQNAAKQVLNEYDRKHIWVSHLQPIIQSFRQINEPTFLEELSTFSREDPQFFHLTVELEAIDEKKDQVLRRISIFGLNSQATMQQIAVQKKEIKDRLVSLLEEIEVADAFVSSLERSTNLTRGKIIPLQRREDMDRAADNQGEREATQSALQGKIEIGNFDVFLCYNDKDKSEVKKIGEKLKEHGILPWLDEWELRPGLPSQRLLEQQIGEIKSAAVFVGKEGVGPWQQMELEALLREFVARGCPVIPVVLVDAPEKPQLPVFLHGMTWVDFHMREPDPMKQLIWGITSKRPGAEASKDAHDATAIAQSPRPKVTSLSFSKKGELVDDLLACACISNRDSRQTVLGLLNEQFPAITDSISRRSDNRADVMEIISTCLKHSGSLAVLVDIVCYLEGETSIYAQQLRAFIQDNAL